MITPGGRGKAYFIERLLMDVMFAESGLAGVNRRVEVQKGALQLAAYVAMTLIAVLGVVVFTGSYRGNRSYIADVEADVNDVERDRAARSLDVSRKPCCRGWMPFVPYTRPRTGSPKPELRCRCGGDCSRAMRSATPRATPTRAS